MSGITLARAITSELVLNFQGLASQGSKKPLGLSAAGASADISSGLRTGAQTLASAVQVLNATISFVNVADADLEKLGKITDKMLSIVEEAAGGGIGYQRRLEIDNEYRRLGQEFRDIVDLAEYEGDNYLTLDGLGAIFARSGLSQEESDSIQGVLSEFVVGTDGSLASVETKGARPPRVSQSAYAAEGRQSYSEFEDIFDPERSLLDRVDASVLAEDLRALKSQITDNREVLTEARKVVGLNLDLVSSTGLAMLEVAEKITSADDADKVAHEIRTLVRKDARAALAQAENLEPIIVATLAFASE